MKANFDETAKADADDMVENLRASFKELVTETDWMDSETQGKAITKADQMLQLIGYPDWLVDVAAVDAYYSTAPVTSEQDHLGNVLATDHWAAIQDLITLRAKPERDIWLMHPAIVNAWYSPNHNTISKLLLHNFLNPSHCFLCLIFSRSKLTMVLIQDGSSEHVAHVR